MTKRYVKSTADYVAENILSREFNVNKLNQNWITDVTQKHGNSPKAYLSSILDLDDNTIVGYVLGHSNNNDLMFNTVDIVEPIIIARLFYFKKIGESNLYNKICVLELS